MNKMFWNSREYLWRRKEKTKNRIRIMPKPEDSEAKWWMRVDIHVVQTIYERRQFVCNKQLFNLSCKLCNMKKRFKGLHFRDNWLLCSGQRLWEIVAATIEERLRLYGSKTQGRIG